MNNKIFRVFSKKILKSEAFISVVIVFVLALGIIGTSYALYMDVDTDTDYQLVNVGDLAIGFENGSNEINLTNLLPLEDSEAVSKTDNIYSFNIYNTGTYTAYYTIKLVTMDGNEVDTNYINYQFCKTIGEGNCTINTLSNKQDGLIYEDMLDAKAPDELTTNPYSSYMIRVWINNKYVSFESKDIKLKLVVEATNKDNDACFGGNCGGISSELNLTCEEQNGDGYEICYPKLPETYTLPDINSDICLNDISYANKVQSGSILGVPNVCYVRPKGSTNMDEWDEYTSNLYLDSSVSNDYKYNYYCDAWYTNDDGEFRSMQSLQETKLIDSYQPKIYDILGNNVSDIHLTNDLTNTYYCDNYHGKLSIGDAISKKLIGNKSYSYEDETYKYYSYNITDGIKSNANSSENVFLYQVAEEKINSCTVPIIEQVGNVNFNGVISTGFMSSYDEVSGECVADRLSDFAVQKRNEQMQSYVDSLLSSFTINGQNALELKEYISLTIGGYQIYSYSNVHDIYKIYELDDGTRLGGFSNKIEYYNSCDLEMYSYDFVISSGGLEFRSPCESD